MEGQQNNNSPEHNQDTETETTHSSPNKKEGAGAFVGVVIIVIVLILGGLYFWGIQLNNQQQRKAEQTVLDSVVNNNIATPQDAPTKIQTDLNKFNTTEFDSKLNADLNAINSAL